MTKDPARLRRLFEQAMTALQQGRPSEAEGFARELIQADPSFMPNHLMGVITLQQGRAGEAVEYFTTALRLQPGEPGATANLGLALLHSGRPQEALTELAKATAAAPSFVDAWVNRGLALTALNRFEEAVRAHEQALALNPDHAGGWYNRGIALAGARRLPDAVASYDRALALAPGAAAILADRGAALMGLGRREEALDNFDRALVGMPGNSDILAHRGIVLASLGRQDAALASYDWALASNPNDARLWDAKGMTLWQMNRFDEAVAAFNQALAIAPDFPLALNHRGTLLWSALGRAIEARADLERAVALDPGQAYALGELLHLKFHAADWNGTAALKAQVEAGARAGAPVIRPFAFQPVSGSPADLQACARIFARDLFVQPPGWSPTPAPPRDKLRIGYVSGEFHEQATAYLTAGLYEAHDRDRFELVAFDNGIDDSSAMRARLRAAFDKFVVIAGLDDPQAVEAVRAEKVDILVNLNGWFGRHRSILFAERCAPLQVNYLGFPGTMGGVFMDYIIADPVVIPPGEEPFFDEKVVRLPGSYQVNDDKRAIAEDTTRAAHGLPEDAFVFCNFNQSYKIHPESFAAWMAILNEVPGSRLWLLAGPDGFAENLRREAQSRGIDGARLIFAPLLPHDRHLARLKLADLFLDCLPYGAHTTASDALWAGTPVLTCKGTAFAGRVAASLLTAAGLPELVTENWDGYRSLAVALAKDRVRLDALRGRLAANRKTCALFDTKGFARHIEAAYRTMWDIHAKGEAPRGFDVPA
jgi:predicted O-linked N-acetylglucosamine transferase (SPINDLY family)